MAIRPVQAQWTIYVKDLTGKKYSFAIEKVMKLNVHIYIAPYGCGIESSLERGGRVSKNLTRRKAVLHVCV